MPLQRRTAPPPHRLLRLTVSLVVIALVAVACGSDPADSVRATDAELGDGGRLEGAPADVELGEGGWLDGSPADADAAMGGWDGHGDGERAASPTLDSGATADEMFAADGALSAEGLHEGIDDSPASSVAPTDVTPLRAGSVDDNADLDRYLAYRARFAELGIPVRALDVSVRHVVAVAGRDGRPVNGQPVEVLAGGELVGTVRTGTDGRALVHPRALGAAEGAAIELRVDGRTAAPADDVTTFDLDREGGASDPIALDLFFVLDATGSMGGELARLTATVDSVAARVAALEGEPDVRLGMTVYRDEGDAFVTRTFDFTRDVAAFQEALGEVRAVGGGDYPEALDEALAAALDEPAWRDPADTVQLTFVVADAPPQVGRDVPKPYDESLRDAASRGIRIFTVGASGTDDQAEYVFRQLAQFTGARFVFLSYGAAGAAVGPGTDITALDDEELPLEELLLRLVAEELAHLTGDDTPLPPPTTSTTVDPRQQQEG
jgi:hypothetical protein